MFLNSPQLSPAAKRHLPILRSCLVRKRFLSLPAYALAALAVWAGALHAQVIPVPNGSFESPGTIFVDPRVDSWQRTPQPFWFNPADWGGYTWDQTSGVFKNTAPGLANHIDNCDGAQAIYLFGIPQAGLFQDYDSIDWAHTTPTHAFDAVFAVGRSYTLTVGVIGGSGMAPGAGLQLSLYYRDNVGGLVPVGATDIQYSLSSFPTITHLNDYQVTIPIVQAGDAWAGKHIGIGIMATSMGGTYWDLDNVRLSAVPEPSSFALLALGAVGAWAARRCGRRASR